MSISGLHPIPPEMRRAIAEAYAAGRQGRVILARRFRVSPSTVLRVVAEAGLPRFPVGRRPGFGGRTAP